MEHIPLTSEGFTAGSNSGRPLQGTSDTNARVHDADTSHGAPSPPQNGSRPARRRAGTAAPCSREATRPLSYPAYLAEHHFEWDLSIALVLPLLMVMSVARSVDPRVGQGPGGAQRCDLAPLAALMDIRCSAWTFKQVVHILRHLPSYAVLLPLRLGDWPSAVINTQVLAFTAILVLLAVSPRSSRLWAFWRRWRLTYIVAVKLGLRGLLVVPSFLLLQPHTWPTHYWSHYVVSASTSPLPHTIMLSLLDQAVKVTVGPSVVLAVVQTAAAFSLAYRVAPTILTLRADGQRAEQRLRGQPVPLQCSSGLRPEHSALLSCRPLPHQVLLGLAMVAWPVWLSWAVERRLRRQHAAMCSEWERRRQTELACGSQPDTERPQQPGQRAQGTCTPAAALTAAAAQAVAMAPVGDQSSGSHGTVAARRPAPYRSARYRSPMKATMVTVKVQEHMGSFEEYGSRLESVLRDVVREQLAVAAEPVGFVASACGGSDVPAQAAAVDALLWTSIIRGCVQVVLWGWVPEGLGGMEEAVVAESLLRRLARRLACIGAGGGARGVLLQVGQTMAQDGGSGGSAERAVAVRQEQRGQQQQHGVDGAELEEVLRFHGVSTDGSSGAARLLQVDPPAASVAALAASGFLTVRLLLHSPVPQPVRMLVLAEGEGLVGVTPGGEHVGGSPPLHRTRARLLQAVPVELMGGLQEVELVLGPGELAGLRGAGSQEVSDAVGMLRVLLVGLEHSTTLQREGPAAPPLVHCVAPPLLLLPDVAAQELCDLWERIKQEEEAEQEEETEQGAAGGFAPLAGAWEAHVGAERQSSLWWSHLAPLLGDLAYVLGAGGQRERAEKATGAHPDLQALLPYLLEHGMHEMVALAEASCVDTEEPQTQYAKEGASASTTRLSAAAASSPTGSTSPATYSASRKPPANTLHSLSEAVATPSGGGTASATAAAAVPPSLLPVLPRPFYPPSLEAAYQAWRLAGLAGNAPYVLAFRIAVFLMMTNRIVVSTWAPGGAWAGALPWARIGNATAITVLTSAGDVAGLALLYVLALLRSRRPSRQQERQQQLHVQQQKAGDTEGARPQAGVGAHGTVFSPSDGLLYQLATCVVGPALWLLSAVCVAAGITPLDDVMLSDGRIVYSCSWVRAVIGPCLQQMSAWEAVAAAPLLGLAGALMVAGLRPGWGKFRAAAVAVVWQLCAVGVSAALERRSRRRYLRQRAGE